MKLFKKKYLFELLQVFIYIGTRMKLPTLLQKHIPGFKTLPLLKITNGNKITKDLYQRFSDLEGLN